MDRLEELPQDLRWNIFRYLLAANYARPLPNHILVKHYNLEVNLLRVNKVAKEDAMTNLYGDNKFFKLNWYYERGHESMVNHEVPCFKKAESFDHHIADITIKSDQLRNFLNAASPPPSPLAAPDMETYMMAEVAFEHWVMHQLGVKGPIPYEGEIEACMAIVMTNRPHPNPLNANPRTARIGEVCPDILKKHADKYNATMNNPAKGAGKIICSVGLNAGQIDEESVLDDPNHVRFIHHISNLMRQQIQQ